jgi:uncharacterized ParB-like nuclease family protein
VFFRKKTAPVKCFQQEFRHEILSGPIDLGVRSVDIDRIVGSVARCQDFPEGFDTKRAVHDSRLKAIEKAMAEGTDFSPIELYMVKDDYYVLDGHHRVVAARELGQRDIDAHVVEYLPQGRNPEDALYRERALFEMKTKLEEVKLSQNGSYHLLLSEIEEYQKQVQASQGTISMEDAARSWYSDVYQPKAREIENSGILGFFVGLTPGDLYAFLRRHQHLRKMHRGSPGPVKDLQVLTAELRSLIKEDPNLTSKKTIQELEEILPPCLYASFCPRWPAQERSLHSRLLRSISNSFSDASRRLR